MLKLIFAVLVSFAALTPVSVFAEPPPLCGDVNLDGVVDIADAMIVARGEVFSDTIESALCDVDNDGICNVVDALKIARGEVKQKRCGNVKAQ